MTLDFQIAFHGPFVVSSGTARHGLDVSVDWHDPLPGRTLRGLLRHRAVHLLGLKDELIAEIFGSKTPRGQAPWVFEAAELQPHRWTSPNGGLWNRVKLDSDGRSADRFLATGEQVWAKEGSFSIVWDGPSGPPQTHILALRASARAVTSLGLHRRRGRGWVSITDGDPWTRDDSVKLLGLAA